jgi:hypothetical protein
MDEGREERIAIIRKSATDESDPVLGLFEREGSTTDGAVWT